MCLRASARTCIAVPLFSVARCRRRRCRPAVNSGATSILATGLPASFLLPLGFQPTSPPLPHHAGGRVSSAGAVCERCSKRCSKRKLTLPACTQPRILHGAHATMRAVSCSRTGSQLAAAWGAALYAHVRTRVPRMSAHMSNPGLAPHLLIHPLLDAGLVAHHMRTACCLLGSGSSPPGPPMSRHDVRGCTGFKVSKPTRHPF